MKKLNLGCGPSGKNGWINYDWGILPLINKLGLTKILVQMGILDKNYLVKWPKFFLVDIRKRFPLNDDEIDYVYCSHVLEHFEPWEAKKILTESRRVLKKGGKIRLILPDIAYIIKNYGDAGQFNEFVFGYNKEKKYRFSFFIRGHQWMYDKKSFKKLLEECGFKKIKLSSWKKGSDLEIHKNMSFYYEAEK